WRFLYCSGRSLLEIPSDLPRDVIRLDLSDNNIKVVPVEAFQNCSEVREILLDRNVIEQLDKEVFLNLVRLDVLGLAGNQLSHLATNTFGDAQALRRLVLNENPLVMPDEGPFLEQEELEELEMARCNLTELTKDTFSGLAALKWLNLAGNEFDEDLGTDVFEPLENLQRLHVPPLSEDTVRDLCDVVKSIDVVDITTHNISCFYLASETSYEESIITQRPITPEPKREPEEDSEESKPTRPTKQTKKVILKENEIDSDQDPVTLAPQLKPILPTRRSSSTTTTTVASPTVSGPSSASITHTADAPKDDVKKETTPDQGDQSLLASISSDTMKQLLMGIIGLGLLILLIGIICRQTGLKNKLCGSKRRPAPTDQVRPAEEVPLNKV
ncbi:AAEL003859-PA, partial [Aedes aegypti]